jgi:hypothetical protein
MTPVRRLAVLGVALLLPVASCASGGEESGAVDGPGGAPTTTATSTTTTTTTTTATTATVAPLPIDDGGHGEGPLPATPPRATSPALAVALVVAGEARVHDPTASDGPETDEVRRAAMARAILGEQLALRAIADHPEWDDAVAALLPPADRRRVADDVRANRELRALVAAPKSTLPAWTIVAPRPAAELRRYYEEAQAATGVPWEYLAAVHLVETRMGRLRGTSTAGAQGPMQFLPATWAAYGRGGDVQDDHDAILGAATYLAANGGGAGRLAEALFRYNHSDHYVRAVTLYAERMRADPASFVGYHGWQVVYWTTLGDVVLPVGYSAAEPQAVSASSIASIEGAK